ncbi:hypothetical protein STEG23_011869 [Scotinomys teguina]
MPSVSVILNSSSVVLLSIGTVSSSTSLPSPGTRPNRKTTTPNLVEFQLFLENSESFDCEEMLLYRLYLEERHCPVGNPLIIDGKEDVHLLLLPPRALRSHSLIGTFFIKQHAALRATPKRKC